LSGNFDLGVLASVLVLGPLTMIRPLVIVAGAGLAAACADTLAAAVMSIGAGMVMVSFERILTLGQPPWRGLEGDAEKPDRHRSAERLPSPPGPVHRKSEPSKSE